MLRLKHLYHGRIWSGVALGVLILAACSPAEPQARPTTAVAPDPGDAVPPHHPVSGLDVVPLVVARDGERHVFQVEVARTSAQQARGLMFREAMGQDEGMIFPRNPPAPAAFWMKNTVIPLDIIFVGPDGRINNIVANAEPYSLDPRLSVGAAGAVLELNGGRAAELGIRPGDRVEWSDPARGG
ncbi:MAG: DUF192 domain-containing protein [Novosphingobium sp.]|nr:DUF192 domain-containing protein [Novosphingobium sp.]